jgi:hypothetical protein
MVDGISWSFAEGMIPVADAVLRSIGLDVAHRASPRFPLPAVAGL